MRALVLSGGGSRGAYQVGALRGLADTVFTEPEPFDAWLGTSVGAIGCGYLAQTHGTFQSRAKEYEALWRSIRQSDIYRKTDDVEVLLRLSQGHTGMYDNTATLRLLQKHMTGTSRALVTKVSLETEELALVAADVMNIFASATMPIIWSAIDREWVDGGLREQTPLDAACDLGADEIVVVLTGPLHRVPERNPMPSKRAGIKAFLAAVERTISIMSHEIFVNDLKRILDTNKLKRAGLAKPGQREIAVRPVIPAALLGDVLDFGKAHIAGLIDMGYKDATQAGKVVR